VATANRTRQLIDDADREVVLVVGNETVYTDTLASRLNAAGDRGVSVIVAVPTRT
jgi:sugar-specific transcriptional regulator TrmB